MSEAEQVADNCLQETGARRFGRHARSVALVAITVLPDGEVDPHAYRQAIRKECWRRKSEYGSIFLIIVLPIIINLISAWILQWIQKRNHGSPLRRLRSEAFDAL